MKYSVRLSTPPLHASLHGPLGAPCTHRFASRPKCSASVLGPTKSSTSWASAGSDVTDRDTAVAVAQGTTQQLPIANPVGAR